MAKSGKNLGPLELEWIKRYRDDDNKSFNEIGRLIGISKQGARQAYLRVSENAEKPNEHA
ncbi:MAG: hypothetical protein AAF092_10605 [Pseudomonadota bacterium]